MYEQNKCHDACPNAVQLSSNLVQVHKIGLSIEFLTKTPKIWKTTCSICKRNWQIDHHIR